MGEGEGMTDPVENQILYALFCLSRETRHISAASLGAVADVTPTRAAAALVALERAGLVDASRARLTMLGLAKAVCGGAALGGTQIQSERRRPAPPRPTQEPLAARDATAAVAPDACRR